jgi:pimeloyl-ACP methyl ester carboxylesterase
VTGGAPLSSVLLQSDGTEVVEHTLEVPLDHTQPDDPRRLSLFAREFRRTGAADHPVLLYLQGGPGMRALRPPLPAWVGVALERYRVVMLDQRGTGRSTPVTAGSMGPLLADVDAAVDYLSRFRADAIVGDAECLREALGVPHWSTLGQSYGGFLTLTYLSEAPTSLTHCFVSGGLTSPTAPVEEVYALTLATTETLNTAYVHANPGDAQTLLDLFTRVRLDPPTLCRGQLLTARLLRQIGGCLGTRTGQEKLHYLLADALVPEPSGGIGLGPSTLGDIESLVSFRIEPLYAVLHESIYPGSGPTAWAAERVLSDHVGELPTESDDEPPLLLGEITQRWRFDPDEADADPALTPFAAVADRLAAKDDWPPLYDPERLAANSVPVFATAYLDDMFVPFELSRRAAQEIGGVRLEERSDLLHDGLRDGTEVITDLFRRSDEDTAAASENRRGHRAGDR